MPNFPYQEVIDRILAMRIMKIGNSKSPHKYILLLTLIRLYEQNDAQENKFPLDALLESTFKSIWLELFPEANPQTIMIEHPFYHLINDGFWFLGIRNDKRAVYEEYDAARKRGNARFTKRRLIETVEYAQLLPAFHECLSDPFARDKVDDAIRNHLRTIDQPHATRTSSSVRESTSLYGHEADAIRRIDNAVKVNNLGYICSNLDIHDPQSNRYFEIDLLLISPFGIYVVELKHWTGNIHVKPNMWLVNGFSRPDPHKGNNHKAKLIRGLCTRKFPYFKWPYVDSIVTLTHPDAVVTSSSLPNTSDNNPTFDSINHLIDYLKRQRRDKEATLSSAECKNIFNFIKSLHIPGRPSDMQFPGYEIVTRMYHSAEREEMIARRTDIRYRRLTRLRIFFAAQPGSDMERDPFVEQAMATLNAVAGVGEHPNILRVWSIPNEYGHIVEGSDWSEQGTLRNAIDTQAPFDMEKALTITRGVLHGLQAIHEIGVIHRSLSPENILLVEDVPKLMNFDLSYQLADDRTTVIPDPSKLKRQPYIAPEIYQNADSLSESADMFSVGVLLCEMLTGERPFKCSTDLAQTNGRLPERCLDKLRENNIPDSAISLINDLVQLTDTARPATVSDILQRLDKHVAQPVPAATNLQLKQGDSDNLYEIVEFLGKGAESQTYRARGPMGEPFVLKFFNIDVPQDRIFQEQKLSAAVSHPAIAKAENYCRWSDQRLVLAFKAIDGYTLREQAKKELPELNYFNQIAQTLIDAINALHSYKEDGDETPILHNDIKPENIVVTCDGRPVLLDFGIASHPKIAQYAGSNGYVPPDMISGEDREYCVQGDLFGLGVTLFEWFFGRKPYETLIIGEAPVDMQNLRPDISPELRDWFARAVASQAENRFSKAVEMRDSLQKAIETPAAPELPEIIRSEEEISPIAPSKPEPWQRSKEPEPEVVSFAPELGTTPNPFVAYLNSLHNRDASSGNALAEGQAQNPWFSRIHVAHPLANRIAKELIKEQRHVILTGHAGDGKSTIGLELFKLFSRLPADKPILRDLQPIEEITQSDGIKIALIKDFSEWTEKERIRIIKNAGKQNQPRTLLVSNTGTLLDVFRRIEERENGNWIEIESDLLKTFSESTPAFFEHRGVSYLVINLAMFDNLDVAREIFERMLAPGCWKNCVACEHHAQCPIRRNVELLQKNLSVALDRVFLLYRRMFEYGDRFTLRQLTAHLAYMITSGMEYSDIIEFSNRPIPPLLCEFMFFNRFFGDNGRHPDSPALQMSVVRAVRSQEFGKRPCPRWEKRLWLRKHESDFYIEANDDIHDFDLLRRVGAGEKDSQFYKGPEGILSARGQVRRMLFFLHKFRNSKDIFLSTFLHSPMMLELMDWRTGAGTMSIGKKDTMRRRVTHVLQEHFTGIRIPEGASSDNNLYITLSRNAQEIRQSAQVVLAHFHEDDFDIEFESVEDGADRSQQRLVFTGTERYKSARLILELPFLDYVMMRHQGETGQALQTAFVDRLDRFKAYLAALGKRRDRHEIMLVRLRTNHTFRRQRFSVGKGQLEVTDA